RIKCLRQLWRKFHEFRPTLYEERKARLRALLAGVPGILFVDSVEDGAWLYNAVLRLKLEGVVAKRAGSLYRGGASDDWRKIKVPGYHRLGKFTREPLE
ncbi:hypothetical protein IPF36_17250, partial [Cupriavidus sp. IK-TO18]|nr:hypothetical protein [Cupriavidus sp. IK-TO18]